MEWTGARDADMPTAEAQTWIDAPPERVWPLVADIELMPKLSDELQSVEWLDPAAASAPPMFLWHTAEDAYVQPEHSYRLAAALSAAGPKFWALDAVPRLRPGQGSLANTPFPFVMCPNSVDGVDHAMCVRAQITLFADTPFGDRRCTRHHRRAPRLVQRWNQLRATPER
jgi:Polyketide cyclase / dehydrase and lipid transport